MAWAHRGRRWRVRVTEGMARCGIVLLRTNLGIVFLWFGVLKFFPGLSPAEQLAGKTISALTLGHVSPAVSEPLLALLECAIGAGLISGLFPLLTVTLLLVQMAGTLTPLLLFRPETFIRFPFAATLEGQYIIKNIVLIAAAVVIGATADGGGLVRDRERLRQARTSSRPTAWREGDLAGDRRPPRRRPLARWLAGRRDGDR